jgi:hypothetical protein
MQARVRAMARPRKLRHDAERAGDVMAELVRDIVLTAYPSSLLGKIRTSLGIDRIAAVDFTEHQDKINGVTGFAHSLWERYFLDTEMPVEAINVSRVNRLVGEVTNGGLWQFVQNTSWNKYIVEGTRDGLKAVGAEEHLAVFDGAAQMIEEANANGGNIDLDAFDAKVERLETEFFSDANLRRRLRRRVDASWTWGDRWAIARLLTSRYIDGLKNIRVVAPQRYEEELDRLMPAIPDLEFRRAARADARPWEKKTIERVMTAKGLDHVWYTAFSARAHGGKTLWCWNFTVGTTPSEGHHQAIFVDGEVIVYKGHTDEIVTRAPCPEAAEGSTAPRVEPDQEPGTEGPNIIIRIDNP